MKRVTPTEARRRWFRLLDEVAAGEVVMIERRGRRIVLRADTGDADAGEVPAYADVLSVPNADDADRWTWDWSPEDGLRPRTRRRRS